MEMEQRLDALIRLAERAGIQVRHEPMEGSGGGMCVMRGQRVLFVDTSAPPDVRYERLVSELAGAVDLDAVYVVPALRRDIEAARPDNPM